MDKKSITKREMKVRNRIRREVFHLHTGPESWYTACRHIKEHNEANTNFLPPKKKMVHSPLNVC